MPVRKYRRRKPQISDKRIKRVAKRTILRNAETKYHAEYDLTPIELTSTELTALDLTNVAIGDLATERAGSLIQPTQFFFRYEFNAKSSGVGDNIRVILFRWRGDSAPTFSDIMQLSSTSVAKIFSHITNDKAKKSKFTMLYDRHHEVPSYANSFSGRSQTVTVRIPMSRLAKIKFDSAATTGTNHIYLLAIGNNSTGVTATNFNYVSNLSFKDI